LFISFPYLDFIIAYVYTIVNTNTYEQIVKYKKNHQHFAGGDILFLVKFIRPEAPAQKIPRMRKHRCGGFYLPTLPTICPQWGMFSLVFACFQTGKDGQSKTPKCLDTTGLKGFQSERMGNVAEVRV